LRQISHEDAKVEVGISFALAAAPLVFNEGSPVFGLGKPKAVVGLDIGSSAVKAVELKPAG
jgi:hypothetical protein